MLVWINGGGRHLKVLGLAASFALMSGAASAACLNPPASAEAVNQFKSDANSVLGPIPDARRVEGATRDLAGTDASLAADLVRVAKSADAASRTAIAAGLAQAALACAAVDQKASQAIQQAVAEFQDGEFQASFAAVAGDLSTAAIAAVAASAASSAGSVAVNNPTATGAATTAVQATATRRSTNTGPFSFSGLSTTGSSSSSAVTAADSVSPVR